MKNNKFFYSVVVVFVVLFVFFAFFFGFRVVRSQFGVVQVSRASLAVLTEGRVDLVEQAVVSRQVGNDVVERVEDLVTAQHLKVSNAVVPNAVEGKGVSQGVTHGVTSDLVGGDIVV